MNPVALDHVTIRTGDIEGTRDLLIALFDLELGERPLAIQRIPGCWLYANAEPIIHIIGGHPLARRGDPGSEAYDHIGIRISDVAELQKRLAGSGLRYQTNYLEELSETRIFFFLPGGHLIEAVSRDDPKG